MKMNIIIKTAVLISSFLCLCYSKVLFPASPWPSLTSEINLANWRRLEDYRYYKSITLQIYDLPLHPVSVNFTFEAQKNDDDCEDKDIKAYAVMYGIPVVSRHGESFPENTYVKAASVKNISLSTSKIVHSAVSNLREGQLYLMVVMPRPSTRIKQKGLGVNCQYHLTTKAQTLYYKDEEIPRLLVNSVSFVQVKSHSKNLLSFKAPMDITGYAITIAGCHSIDCQATIVLRERLNLYEENSVLANCTWKQGSCQLSVVSPEVDTFSYLIIEEKGGANYNFSISINATVCTSKDSKRNPLATPSLGATSLIRFAGELGRETPRIAPEDSNFYDRFIMWSENFTRPVPVSIPVDDNSTQVVRFHLRNTDTGTSLQVATTVKEHPKNQVITRVSICLSLNRISTSPEECENGGFLNVSTAADEGVHHLLVPYPQTGAWYISLAAQCFPSNSSLNVSIPCEKSLMVNLTVRLSPCVDNGCGRYGSCLLHFGADVLYHACHCISGWRGYACNDGSEATSSEIEKLSVYLLTLSNLGFVPGIILALYRHYYVEALVYTYNMFSSTFYHACDASKVYQLCILNYDTLSFADFFSSLLSFWMTLMAMSRISPLLRSLLHMGGVLFIAAGEVYDRHGLVTQLLPLACGVSLVIISWGYEMYKRKALFPSKRRLLKFILPGIGMACLGLALNLGVETQENYKYVHSMWHILESGAIIFLLPPARGKRNTANYLSIQSGDITANQTLEESEPLQANLRRADGFHDDIGSEHSSPGATARDGGFKLTLRGGSHSQRRSPNLVL